MSEGNLVKYPRDEQVKKDKVWCERPKIPVLLIIIRIFSGLAIIAFVDPGMDSVQSEPL
jgi:hypothetical protein